jgi:hypothetical protein
VPIDTLASTAWPFPMVQTALNREQLSQSTRGPEHQRSETVDQPETVRFAAIRRELKRRHRTSI